MIAIVIWIFAALGTGLAVLAARSYFLERREGLPRSTLRLGACLAIAGLLLGLGVYTQLRDRASAPALREPQASVDPAKLAELREQVARLSDELVRRRSELEAVDPSAVPVLSAPPSLWPMFAAVALLLLGIAALTFGDLSTLIPRRRRDNQAAAEAATSEAVEVADLPTLTAHVGAGRWRAGARIASRIAAERLHKLEVLDLLFLGAYCHVSAVAAPEDGKQLGSKDRTEHLAAAARDLARLRELAPHMAEARWLAGYAAAHAGEWRTALDTMRAARPGLASERAFDRDESVCLLRLAEAELAAANGDAAAALFDEVTQIGVLANQIPVALVTHRILAVRNDIKASRFAEAARSVGHIREVSGLEAATQRAVTLACDVYDAAIQFRSGEHDRALATTCALLARWLPANLPDVEDQVADEFLLPAIDAAALALPAHLCRALCFLEAVTRVELAARHGQPLASAEVEAIATALLRALQFQPRHREALAALAALYLGYRKERTEKALTWLDAALTMGVRSKRASHLLSEARRIERERKELLAMFRAASTRFLSDPAVARSVREALIEELGRFDEFRPVLFDLQAAGALDAAPAGEVTVAALRERAAFVGGVASEVVARSEPGAGRELAEVHRELTALVNSVDSSASRIAALERAVMARLGRIVLR